MFMELGLSYLVPFIVGYFLYNSSYLFRDLEEKKRIRFVFAINFMLAINMYILILYKILGILNLHIRLILWKIDINLLSILLILVIPVMFFNEFVNHHRHIKKFLIVKLILVSLMEIVYLILYKQINTLFIFLVDTKKHSNSLLSNNLQDIDLLLNSNNFDEAYDNVLLLFEHQIINIGVVGVTCIALLSGFGAINNPYRYLPMFLSKHINEDDILAVQNQLKQLMESIYYKKKHLALLKQNPNFIKKENNSVYSKLLSFFTDLNKNDDNTKQLIMQIESLEDLSTELFLEINEKKNQLNRYKLRSTTLWGKFESILGYLFSIYCIFKMVLTTINVVFNRDPKRDPITVGFRVFFYIFSQEEDIIDFHFWAQTISFFVVGILAFVSIRGFVLAIGKMFTYISTSSLSPNAFILLLNQLMGMYFIASILLMRMNMPAEYRDEISAALGKDIRFKYFHRWFDRTFLLSACITIIMLYIIETTKISRTAKSFSSQHVKLP